MEKVIIEEKILTSEESNATEVDPEIKSAINLVDISLNELRDTIIKNNKIKNIWLEHLRNGKNLIDWTIKKYKIQFGSEPTRVKKNEIFYCNLGVNIGSEQGDEQGKKEKRPVVILQNDKGNDSSPVTIIAPVTTHEGTVEQIEEFYGDKKIIKNVIRHGDKIKKLDYYEIPIDLVPGFTKEIKGYVNLAQIRVISKKRLEKSPVAAIDDETLKKINKALKKLLTMQ